jgi:hypothetical protein
MGPFPPSEGYNHILVVVDYVTKWVEAIPIKSVDGETLLKMLKDVIFPRFGVPRYLMTDRGSHFIHGGFRKTLARYDVSHIIASAYHPQTSGQVALSNRDIKSILQKTINRSRKNWASKLNDALWAYRTTYKNPMGMSPYKMVYRKACHLPLELEHKAFWAVKELNRDFKLAGKKRLLDLSSLDEWRNEAYENARGMIREFLRESFMLVRKFYCIGLVSDFLQENYSQNGNDPLLLKRCTTQVR